jgi:hypothetical protein
MGQGNEHLGRYAALGAPAPVGTRKNRLDLLLASMPYGRRVCANGREVLFNRRYEPIHQRFPGGSAWPADRAERVEFIDQTWFYRDDTPAAVKQTAVCAILLAWGLPVPAGPDWRVMSRSIRWRGRPAPCADLSDRRWRGRP